MKDIYTTEQNSIIDAVAMHSLASITQEYVTSGFQNDV